MAIISGRPELDWVFAAIGFLCLGLANLIEKRRKSIDTHEKRSQKCH